MLARLSFSVAFLVGAVAVAAPAPDGFFRFPSIAGDTVVFASEGDLWKVPLTGGTAMRLTGYEGDERLPHLSPDGKWVAFTAEYDGNPDVYVMSSDGGEPSRLTFHPGADEVIGWTAGGEILYRSRRDTPHGDKRVWRVSPAGGLPTMIPLEPAAWIAFEPNGKRIALQKIGLENHSWKRYKGGEAEDIEVGTLDPLAFSVVTKWDGKDAFPMWAADGRIYFVTDRWGRPNLASMTPDGGDVKQLTRFDDYDVRWPSLGGTRIVFQHAMELWVLDIRTGESRQIPARLPSDRLQTRERFVDPMATRGAWALSPDGARIVLETRGDLFVARTHKKGLIRRITESSLSRTKDPAFSPDGKWIAAWTEVSGEEQLVLHAADHGAPSRQLGTAPAGWHFPPAWAPDGKRIAWSDEKRQLQVTEVASGKSQVVDRGRWEISEYAWSPDGRFLAYVTLAENSMSRIRVWDGKIAHDVTDPAVSSFSPAWDPEGERLYFLADGYINPYLDRYGTSYIVDQATLPYVLALRADGKLPFATRSDLDIDDKKKDDKKEEEEKKPRVIKPMTIDFAGITDRIVAVPVPPANYSGLRAEAKGKLHFLREESRGLMPPDGEEEDDEETAGELVVYDLEEEKLSSLAEEVLAFDLSLDGEVLVFQTKEGYTRLEGSATSLPEPSPDDPEAAKDAQVDLTGWTLRIVPREEWQQMLREAWRLQRDFFYDKAMHGVDWNGVWAKYGPLATRIASRDDLDDLLGEVLGELGAGHAYRWGGDLRRGAPVSTGLLAADLKQDPKTGFWQILRIHRGDWPDAKMASPLARPDLRVKAGQWLVAIDGQPLLRGHDYLERLVGKAGKPVELSVSDKPQLAGARRIIVEPVANDTAIRYATWIRDNRAYVDKMSGGKIGYLHLYDMGGLGLRQFARDFAAQWQKPGLIIDDRWNHGGFVAPFILAMLDRKLLSVGGTRPGRPEYTTPERAFTGHLAVLINRQGGSDCETFAEGIKTFKLGPVIGTRTWGGWVGIRGDKKLRDGGVTTQPEFSGWDPTGKRWLIEGHGVDPDVVLDLGPSGLLGKDTQLDHAIKDILSRIARDPRVLPGAPPIPKR